MWITWLHQFHTFLILNLKMYQRALLSKKSGGKFDLDWADVNTDGTNDHLEHVPYAYCSLMQHYMGEYSPSVCLLSSTVLLYCILAKASMSLLYTCASLTLPELSSKPHRQTTQYTLSPKSWSTPDLLSKLRVWGYFLLSLAKWSCCFIFAVTCKTATMPTRYG